MVGWRNEEEDAMSPVTLDAELIAKLTSNGGKVPLADRDGKPLGYFLPQVEYERMQKAFEEHMYQEPTLEEFRRALANPRRHTMEEVFKLLEGD
jgi:hypothetical protein